MTPAESLAKIRDINQGRLPDFYGIPGVSVSSIRLDVMHICDLGATQVVAGSILVQIVDLMPQGRRADRVTALNRHLRQWYSRSKASCRMAPLTEKGLFADKVPKLRAKAAETRQARPYPPSPAPSLGEGT
jgi:hypothetical protein